MCDLNLSKTRNGKKKLICILSAGLFKGFVSLDVSKALMKDSMSS